LTAARISAHACSHVARATDRDRALAQCLQIQRLGSVAREDHVLQLGQFSDQFGGNRRAIAHQHERLRGPQGFAQRRTAQRFVMDMQLRLAFESRPVGASASGVLEVVEQDDKGKLRHGACPVR
jgi:hypothetical protein